MSATLITIGVLCILPALVTYLRIKFTMLKIERDLLKQGITVNWDRVLERKS